MMSSVLEKTIQKTISFVQGISTSNSMSDVTLKNLQDAILGTNKTMQMREYRSAVENCLDRVKRKSQDMHSSLSEKRECILVILHLCNLNEELTLVNPFVIKFVEDSRTLFDKCIGYTALTLLNKSRGCVYLAVNMLLKEISGKSGTEVGLALTTLASVIDVDLISVFLPALEKIVKSSDSSTRCKALIVLHAMVRIASEFLPSIWDTLAHTLCDRDPHVMSSVLPIIETLLKTSSPPSDCKLNEKVLLILKQVEQGCLPIDMMYRGISGPWIQIRLFQIIQRLPQLDWTDSQFSQMAEILSRVFARFQQTSYLQVAIVCEGINTIVLFHPKLSALEKSMLDVIDKLLSCTNPNVLCCSIEALKSIVNIKPGFSQNYVDTILSTLSDVNPNSLRLTLELLDDFSCSENSEKILAILVRNLGKVSNFKFRREIFFGMMKVLKKFPIKGKWLMENYLPLLGYFKNDFDFVIVGRLINFMHLLPKEMMQNEAADLARSLKHKFTTLQYCTVLEILLNYHSGICDEDCQKIANDILENCLHILWWQNRDEILALSWNVVQTLSLHYNVNIDTGKFAKALKKDCYIMLRQQYVETLNQVKNPDLMKITMDTFSQEKVDPTLSFLDEYTKEKNDVVCLEEYKSSSQDMHPIVDRLSPNTKKIVKFKIQPYSKSRFDMSGTLTLDETNPKRNFLGDQCIQKRAGSAVWDSKRYDLGGECSKVNNNVD